jgi:RNA polymerase sigma-70 factor, ECF subfamily
MSMNDSMSSVWDQNAEALIVDGTMTADTDDSLGQLLQGFRVYLLAVARRELDFDLRRKCGASDLVQETFREAHRDRKAFRGKTQRELRTWLKKILRNNIQDVRKTYGKTKRQARLEVPIGPEACHTLIDPGLTPGTRALAQEERGVIARAIAELPEDYRRVIELRSRDNRTFHEIGRELKRSHDAARMLWFRAIESLRQVLAESDAT